MTIKVSVYIAVSLDGFISPLAMRRSTCPTLIFDQILFGLRGVYFWRKYVSSKLFR